MAYIRRRQQRDSTVSFTVVWRAGGNRDGKQESEIFTGSQAAERFRDLVNGHGQQWPPGWVRGEGFVEPEDPECGPEEMFGPFADRYIDLLTGIQRDTKAKYRRQVQQRMMPWFRELSVRADKRGIGRECIARWVNDLEAGRPGPLAAPGATCRPLKPKSIANLHGLLFGILQAAVEAEPPLRSANPCTATRLPRGDDVTEDRMTFLERDEFALLLSCVEEGEAQDLVEAKAGTGTRWGEVTAFTPRDLTRRRRRAAVRVQRAWKRDEDSSLYQGPPKTKKSRRTIVLTPELDSLFRRRANGLRPDDLLFPTYGGAMWGAETFRRTQWLPAVRRARLKGLLKEPRVHDLRHSHASWLIAARVPLPAIQSRLGHESITTTVDRYGHLLDALDDEVAEAVGWAMDPARLLPAGGGPGHTSNDEAAASTSSIPVPNHA